MRLSHEAFAHRSATDVATYIFAKANAVEHSTIRKGRHALRRLLDYLAERDIPWDGKFGKLCELDLFSFLNCVHETAMVKGTEVRPGFSAVWGVVEGLTYMRIHFGLQLPISAVRKALPKRGVKRGVSAILTGALPLPPEALDDIFRYICAPDTPPVMVSWAFALAFTAMSSLRQINAQHLLFYGEIMVLGKPYLISHHADGKSRDKSPTLFVTPLLNFKGSRAWYDTGRKGLWVDGDFLWAECLGHPLSPSSSLKRCPLSDGGIQKALQLVLQHACGMSVLEASRFTKHSARKLMVSVAQAGGCPWEQSVELGHWGPTSLDKSFVLPAEDARRKRALECMAMPKRYSANARIMRVARITGNQVDRIGRYLKLRPLRTSSPCPHHTLWDLMPAYNAAAEGA